MTHRRLLIVVVFTAIFTFDLARPTDIDFWWHLRTGELIAQTGSVPTVDPFSYTAAGRPWVVHEWLWELAMYVICTYAGYGAAMVLSASVVTLTYALLYRLLRRIGTNEIVAATLVLWAAVLALPDLGVRPREVTLFFVAAYLHLLWLPGVPPMRRLWLLPALMVVWVNTHGTFVLGLGIMGLVILGETVHWLRVGGRPPRQLWLVGIATLVAATVNPAGVRMLAYPFTYYGQSNNPSFSIVTEFQSPNFHEPLNLLFAGGLVLLTLLGVPGGTSHGVIGLLAAVFSLQALVSTRQIAQCALVLAPALGLALRDRFRWARERPPPRLPRGFAIANWTLLLGLVIAAMVYASQPKIRHRLQWGSEAKEGEMPTAGARYIEEKNLLGPVFNFQPWGGYLISRWYPTRLVFIDGRIDMYGPDVVREYTQVVNISPEWRTVLAKYGVRTVLIPKQSALSVVLMADHGWERVFQGDVEEVFVQKAGALVAPS